MTQATAQEAQGYERWRDGYERNWSGFFDPIGAQLRISDDRILTDLTWPWVIGFRRPPYWLAWWQYVDIDTAGQKKAAA